MDKLPEKPPYVQFEMRAVEDRNASIKTGQYTAKDIPWVLVTPAGSKDILEYDAESWLARQREAVMKKRLDPAWLRYYESSYQAFLKNEEPPENGTPLSRWPGLSPAQHANLKSANLRTIEDVASMNEEAIRRVGMGARALQQRALAFLDTLKSGVGAASERVVALENENSILKATVKDLEETTRMLKSQLDLLRPSSTPPRPSEQEFSL